MNNPENTETTTETAETTAAKTEPKAKAKTLKDKEAEIEAKGKFKPKVYRVGADKFLEAWPEEITVVTDKKHYLFQSRAIDPLDEQMINSIIEHGVLEPPIVVPAGQDAEGSDVYEVVDGRQRVRCAVEANRRLENRKDRLRRIVCKVKDAGAESHGVRLKNILNEHRKEADPMTRAEGMAEYMSVGYDKAATAVDFWTSEKTVDRHLSLLKLDKKLQQAVREKKVTLVDALELGKVSHKEQRAAVERLENGEPLFVEATEESEEEGEGEEGSADAKPVKKKLPKAPAWKKMQTTLKKLKAFQAPSAAKQEKVDIVALVIEGIYGSTKKAAREFDELLEDLGLTDEDSGEDEEETKPKGKKKG